MFYQEVGIRLLAYVSCSLFVHCPYACLLTFVFGADACRILQKHIKRQIISLSGGFQVIADLNAYHAFIASLKVELSF